MAGSMHCPVTSPPAIELSDPNFGMCKTQDAYTMEWAVYAFTAVAAVDSESQKGCTDHFCFVNAQRSDLASNTITMERTGFLGPESSLYGDMTVWDGTGYPPTPTPLRPKADVVHVYVATRTCISLHDCGEQVLKLHQSELHRLTEREGRAGQDGADLLGTLGPEDHARVPSKAVYAQRYSERERWLAVVQLSVGTQERPWRRGAHLHERHAGG